ncbi:sulfur carrier protein ThiS [Undibacterium umbellatum]|jgi:sulfur carrier protein|uniref:Sulfur carrier protein ThiS n=1 Tax=Undibacterium umbellatum TaxID=2762300 RepID=A0ABR6ZGM3_9BURK|nr:sulfur carrier protein ThiS [Undibacterium umbellatum]MBC3910721.1 sulfur carrier protein ThiS [Undibacterium umbellatum]
MLEIQLNGEARQLSSELLADLIAELNLSQQAIAVAVNRQIIPRSQWEGYQLHGDDKVDVVRAIGGG